MQSTLKKSVNRSTILAGLLTVLCGYILIIGACRDNRQQPLFTRPSDSQLAEALLFARAVYVTEWDDVPEKFSLVSRSADGTYKLARPDWDCAIAFNRLARSGWQLYFNHIGITAGRLQDAQILTGSKADGNNEVTFAVSFRGSNNMEDYLFTNCKTDPVNLSGIRVSGSVNGKYRPGVPWDQYSLPGVAAMTRNAVATGLSNFIAAAPVFVHRGYMEQVLHGLGAKVADPADGRLVSLLEAIHKYPGANFILTGHSSGGGAAQILAALLYESGVERRNIHIRTFAAAGAFNRAGQIKYRSLDAINYFIAGDPILILNSLTGYGPIGVSVMISPTRRFSQNSQSIHEMTAYGEQLQQDD